MPSHCEVAAAREAAAGGEDAARLKSRTADRQGSSSSGSSRSGSGSSSRSRPKSLAKDAPRFVIDDEVEVFGLESESSRMINGRMGVVVQYIEDAGRYEVKFGPEQFALLRPDRLRRRPPGDSTVRDPVQAAVPAQGAAAPKPKATSLASLLGLGRAAVKEEDKAPTWQPIWERSGSTTVAAPLNEEQLEALRALQTGQEERTREVEALRKKVVAEFAHAGLYDEGMLEQVFQQQLREYDMQKLLRPQGPESSRSPARRERKPRGEASSSRSASSGTSRSTSRSRSRSGQRLPVGQLPGSGTDRNPDPA